MMEKSKIKNQKSKLSGQVMLLTVLVLGGSMLAASTVAGYLTLLKIRTSSDITNSGKAIFAADTGVELELYRAFKDPDYPKPSFSNGATFDSTNIDEIIKSVGESGNIFRAFQIGVIGADNPLPE